MEQNDPYSLISGYMTSDIRSSMLAVGRDKLSRLTEIRLYAGRGAAFIFPDRIRFLTADGRLVSDSYDKNCVSVTADDVRNIVSGLCHYSLHSYSKELREGYIVLSGGVRVGIAGRVSETSGQMLTEYSSLNFRISRSIKGCAEELFLKTGSGAGSVLICGGVNSGKTTLLRDLCRICGSRMKTVLIDERNELSSCSGGIPQNDVGGLTDILTGSTRSEGILMAIRTLSPEIIFCDEISDENDAEAILRGYGSGVRFAATIHAESYEDIFRRKAAAPLISEGVFTHAVILEGSSFPSRIREIRRLVNAPENNGSITVFSGRSSCRSGRL